MEGYRTQAYRGRTSAAAASRLSHPELVQRTALATARTAVVPLSVDDAQGVVREVVRAPGEALDESARAPLESRFGYDFSGVRVHTDARAAESAAALGARAYTVGRHVVFGADEYRPTTAPGRILLAHELTHVVQQEYADGTALAPDAHQAVSSPEEPAELEAAALADGFASGAGIRPPSAHGVGPMIQRVIPSGRKPGDDDTSRAARQQINAAKGLLADPSLDARTRSDLLLGIRAAEGQLENYRWAIGSGGRRMVGGLGMTTTVNPLAAVAVGLALVAGAELAPTPGRTEANRRAAAALAAALLALAELARRAETTPRPEPRRTVDITPPVPLDPGEDRRRVRCYDSWTSPAGGDAVHDEYARFVAERYGHPSYATVNYWLEYDGLAVDFDHHNPEFGINEFFEAKTRHEILLREWARRQPFVLARLWRQATDQVEILNRCALPGWRLIWFFDDEEVADAVADYLRGVVDEVRHVPWNRELPEGPPPRRRTRSR